jgi:hypothetical protein
MASTALDRIDQMHRVEIRVARRNYREDLECERERQERAILGLAAESNEGRADSITTY